MTLYKVLNEDGTCYHGGSGRWSLPKNGHPGRWMPRIANLMPCKSGYHVLEEDDMVYWLGPAIHKVEVRGKILRHDNKTVVESARLPWQSLITTWNPRTQRLFAADCAEYVLPLFETRFPDDPRPRHAIETARRYANGEATAEELAAARAAARAADYAADAARAADYAADAARAADYAHTDADTERKWQTQRLMFYLNGEHEEAKR